MSDLTQGGSDLLDRLAQSGLFEEQLKPLRLQQQLAQGMMGAPGAQGRNVGNTYVAASPLEHLSGLAQHLVGALIQRNAMGKEQDLATQLGQTRGDYARAMMGAAAPVQHPPEGIVSPDYNPQAAEQQHAQQLQQLGMAGMLSGDPVMSQAGQRMTDPKLALEQQALEQGRQTFPLNLAMEKAKLAAEGPQADLGGKTKAVFEALTKRSEVPKFAPNPVSGRLYDTRTGQEMQGSGGPGDALSDKRLPMMQEKFAKDMDPNNFKSGVLKGNQERSNAADRLLALAVDPLTGGPANLTPQQMSEVSTSLATLIGGGGSSEGSRHELTPYTKGRTMSEVMQWLTDKPQGADQQAFVKQMIDTAKREQGVAQGQIRGAQAQRFSGHLPYFSLFPDAAKSQMQSFGFDPAEVDLKTGKYSPKPVDQADHVPGFKQAPGPATNGTGGKERSFKRVDGKLVEVTQ